MNINNINFTSFVRVAEAGSFNEAALPAQGNEANKSAAALLNKSMAG